MKVQIVFTEENYIMNTSLSADKTIKTIGFRFHILLNICQLELGFSERRDNICTYIVPGKLLQTGDSTNQPGDDKVVENPPMLDSSKETPSGAPFPPGRAGTGW